MNQPPASPSPAQRLYYLHNFQRALDWLRARHADLLGAEEQAFLSGFAALPEPSQALLVRMLMRRGPWFRASHLRYDEVGDAVSAAAPLLAAGFLADQQPMGLDALFALHTKAELLGLLGPHQPSLFDEPLPSASLALEGLGAAADEDVGEALPSHLPPGLPAWPELHASMRKADMRAALQPWQDLQLSHAQWCTLAARGATVLADSALAQDPVWCVSVAALCERLRLMFFGNLHQDWSEFVLADLGVLRYETVAFDAASRAFQTRADVDRYLSLSHIRQAMEAGTAVKNLLPEVPEAGANPWLNQRRAKLLLRMGQACERAQDWALAREAYAQCDYPSARHRHVRVLEQLGCLDEAHALAQRALAAPESEEEAQRVTRMLRRLRKGLGLPAGPRAVALAPAVAALREDLVLDRPEHGVSVEAALRDHWQRPEAPVFYVENTLVNSVFGLLCWPALFAPLPGAFFHPFQGGPADLRAPDFVARRQALFDEALASLDDGSYRARIGQCFADKQGLQSPFVFWGSLTEELLQLALTCIPAGHWRLLFARLLQDLGANRSGLPDLVRFWPAEQRYEFVEVKAPGDKLQDNQIRWLTHCTAHGLPVRVCHVQWRDVPKPAQAVALDVAPQLFDDVAEVGA